jgi:hypothetical protein
VAKLVISLKIVLRFLLDVIIAILWAIFQKTVLLLYKKSHALIVVNRVILAKIVANLQIVLATFVNHLSISLPHAPQLLPFSVTLATNLDI